MESAGKREPTAAEAARGIIRASLKAALATIEQSTGFPYASLVTVGFGPDGAPVLLLSELALHTRNLKADAKASLLFDASDGAGDPLAGGRVTVIGQVERMPETDAGPLKARFLARHPAAEIYAGFADFALWRMQVERAHFVGGFGRIVDLTGEKIVDDLTGGEALVAAEAAIVAHMNEDHSDAIQLYAARLARAPAGRWRMSGLDPTGFDLVADDRAVRLSFARRVTTPEEARRELVQMAAAARSATG